MSRFGRPDWKFSLGNVNFEMSIGIQIEILNRWSDMPVWSSGLEVQTWELICDI